MALKKPKSRGIIKSKRKRAEDFNEVNLLKGWSKMAKLNIEFIPSELNSSDLEDSCLIAQLMQNITIIGLRVDKNESPCNNGKGVKNEQVA